MQIPNTICIRDAYCCPKASKHAVLRTTTSQCSTVQYKQQRRKEEYKRETRQNVNGQKNIRKKSTNKSRETKTKNDTHLNHFNAACIDRGATIFLYAPSTFISLSAFDIGDTDGTRTTFTLCST
mmetsp:Transcript_18901/g.30033  ORF Transcript_18901/g.30033 Transcript_18901/m.30033 type:complete len:124 (+) Transcript_18901:75-446(+)